MSTTIMEIKKSMWRMTFGQKRLPQKCYIDGCENMLTKDDIDLIKKLAEHYKSINNIDEMVKYYLMAIDRGDTESMRGFAEYYKNINNIDEMVKYYLMAMDRGDIESKEQLFDYYKDTNQPNEMVKYMSSFDDVILDDTLKNALLNMKILPELLKTSLINMFLMRTEMSFVYAMCKCHNIKDDRISDLLQIIDNKMKLTIIDDCVICYTNTKLILYECFGHYYCLDCIVSIDKCSMCRINPTINQLYKKAIINDDDEYEEEDDEE
jgi:hypothetical protein